MIRLDFPFHEAADGAQQMMAHGLTIHQRFTCARCESRQTMAEPNMFFTKGRCQECGHETGLVMRGCNYSAVVSRQ